jgi:tetratricopeptide (TPR) repeat protein
MFPHLSHTKFISILLLVFIICCNSWAQSNEIPITTNSEEALSFFLEGRHKYENIQYVTAAALFEEAINTDPEFAMAYLYRSRSGGGFNIERKNLEMAESLIDNVSDGEKHTILFYKAFAEGDDVQQMQHIDYLLKNYPNDKRVHFNAGIYYDFITDYPTALKHYIQATLLDKNYAASFNKIGYCFFDLEYYKAAEEAFQTYIKLIPSSPNPYDSYAELLMKTGRYDESIKQYKNAYKKDLFYTGALAGIGNNYVFKGQFDKAREYYQTQFNKATHVNDKIEALGWVAISYIHEKNFDKALSIYIQLRALAEKENLIPDVVETYINSGVIMIEQGKIDDGITQFKLAESIVDTSKLPATVKENYKMQLLRNFCLADISKGDFSNAEMNLNRYETMVNKRKNPLERKRYNALIAILALKKDNYKESLDLFAKADTEDPVNWYYMADAYQKLGFIETASEYIFKILNWNENTFGFAITKVRLRN